MYTNTPAGNPMGQMPIFQQQPVQQQTPLIQSTQYFDPQQLANSQKGKNYTLIETPQDVETICTVIAGCNPPPVLGLDCEGLIKGKPIALIQLSFQNHSYLFDMLKVNPFDHRLSCNLKHILTSARITKIFHDFCEDCAALINQHGVYCNRVFDTQIAHRVITAVMCTLSNGSNQNQIGLNSLLQKYLGDQVQNTNKKAISKQMKLDETFWHTIRPLNEQQLEYAAQDVIFLPQVFEVMQKYLSMPYLERHCNSRGEMRFENITVQQKVLADTQKCIQYATINNDIKDISTLESGREIVAFIKNQRRDVIFCSLNLGMSGVIKDSYSRSMLEYNSFGDLVYVTVEGFEKQKGSAILVYSRQFYQDLGGGDLDYMRSNQSSIMQVPMVVQPNFNTVSMAQGQAFTPSQHHSSGSPVTQPAQINMYHQPIHIQVFSKDGATPQSQINNIASQLAQEFTPGNNHMNKPNDSSTQSQSMNLQAMSFVPTNMTFQQPQQPQQVQTDPTHQVSSVPMPIKQPQVVVQSMDSSQQQQQQFAAMAANQTSHAKQPQRLCSPMRAAAANSAIGFSAGENASGLRTQQPSPTNFGGSSGGKRKRNRNRYNRNKCKWESMQQMSVYPYTETMLDQPLKTPQPSSNKGGISFPTTASGGPSKNPAHEQHKRGHMKAASLGNMDSQTLTAKLRLDQSVSAMGKQSKATGGAASAAKQKLQP